MDDIFWIVIVVLAVAVLVAIVWWATRGRAQRMETKREEAGELREDAVARMRRADERESLAQEQATEAQRERERAEHQVRQADDVDPDVDRDR